MTRKGEPGRTIYVRVTIDGKRKYVKIGRIYQKMGIRLLEGMPNPGWWEEE